MCYKLSFFKRFKKRNTRSVSLIHHDDHIPSFSFDSTINGECSICLEKMSGYSSIIMLNCNHVFHEKCIDQHTQYGHDFCPYCMKKIDNNGYILL